MNDDGLSLKHFNIVLREITGRFFSEEEAKELKNFIDRHTVTDPNLRKEAAKCWS